MLFKKGEQIPEVDEETENEDVEEDTEMKPKKDWKKILKWGAIGGGTVIGAIVAGVLAKNHHDAAEAALWIDSMTEDEDEETTEDGEAEETTEESAE